MLKPVIAHEKSLTALADPMRRAIFERIAVKPSSVGELSDRFPISQPAVSQHLKVLRDAKLVKSRRAQRRSVYSTRREGMEALRNYVDRFWSDILEAYVRGVKLDD